MGTAIIIKGSDFSDKNLGKVNISSIPLEERVVTAYLSKATEAASYKDALTALVRQLSDNGLWDKTICLYPMLGHSLESMSVNLASENQYPMIFKENAEAKNNYVYFSNKKEISAIPELSASSVIEQKANENLGVFVRFYRDSSEANNGSVLTSYGSGGISTSLMPSPSSARGMNLNFVGSRTLYYGDGLAKRNYAYVNENTLCRMYIDGEVKMEQTFAENSSAVRYSGIFGGSAGYSPTSTPGSTINPNIKLASGELYVFVYGKYSDADMVKLNSIMETFIAAVGK